MKNFSNRFNRGKWMMIFVVWIWMFTIVVLWHGHTMKSHETKWLGYAVVGEEFVDMFITDGFMDISIRDKYEIGLRSDGIVVWRKTFLIQEGIEDE